MLALQAVAALEDIFRDAAPQGGLSHSSSAELLAPKSLTRSALLSAYASPDGSPRVGFLSSLLVAERS
jgi:hypothetical protein